MKKVVLMIVVLMFVGACSDQDTPVTPPEPSLGLEFWLSVEPNDLGGVAVIGKVENVGTLAVRTRTGICMGPGLLFTFLDPQGTPIQVSCECGPYPACPSIRGYTVIPGETIQDAQWFQGLIWNEGVSSPAPPGLYTVLVEFQYWMDDKGPIDRLNRQIQFLWGE